MSAASMVGALCLAVVRWLAFGLAVTALVCAIAHSVVNSLRASDVASRAIGLAVDLLFGASLTFLVCLAWRSL